MGESIQNFRDLTQRLNDAGRLDAEFGLDDKNKLEAHEPLKPPSGWTKFKAALSHIPLLGRAGSLRRARTEVQSYPIRLGEHQTTSRQLLAGLVQDLRKEYGAEIADLALKDVKSDQLLNGHVVMSVFDKAEKLEKSRQSTNNTNLLMFMEAPLQGPSRLRGEKDMNDLFLEHNLPLGSAGSWQDAVGERAASLITKMVQLQVKDHPDYRRGVVSNADFQEAANRALDLYQEVKGMNLPDEVVNEALDHAITQGSSADGMAEKVRHKLLDHLISSGPLNRRDPESALSVAVKEEAERRDADPLPPEVMKSISNNTSDFLRDRFHRLAEELGTEADVGSVWDALEPALTEKIKQQVAEHYDALEMIQSSDTLSPARKKILLDIAATRRIDTTQVREYEAAAREMEQHATDLKDSLESHDFARVFDALQGIHRAFDQRNGAMMRAGAQMWESKSLSGGETTVQTFEQTIKLAVADMTPEEARKIFEALTSEQGHQALQGILNSSDVMQASVLPVAFYGLADAVGVQSGMSLEDTQSEVSKLGQRLDTSELPAHLVMLTVGADTDARGVVPGSRHEKDISPDFQAQTQELKDGKDLIAHMMKDDIDEETGLSETFLKDLPRATFIFNHRLLAQGGDVDKEEAVRTFKEAFRTEQGIDEAAARAVSLVLNQRSIHPYTLSVERSALGASFGAGDYRLSGGCDLARL